MRWMIGPRLHRRFGVFVNVLARVLVQTKPHAFVAQVAGDPRPQRRAAVRVAAGHRADARRHRFAGHAHAARRRRGARGADHHVAPLRHARRRARAHGRGPERVQRRGAARSSTRSTARPRRPPRNQPEPSVRSTSPRSVRAARGDALATTRSRRRGTRRPTGPATRRRPSRPAAASADRPVGQRDVVTVSNARWCTSNASGSAQVKPACTSLR